MTFAHASLRDGFIAPSAQARGCPSTARRAAVAASARPVPGRHQALVQRPACRLAGGPRDHGIAFTGFETKSVAG